MEGEYIMAHEVTKEVVKYGASSGTCLAMILSYFKWHSIVWCFIHGFFSWFYVLYFWLKGYNQ